MLSDNKYSKIHEPKDIEKILCKTSANVFHFSSSFSSFCITIKNTELNSKIPKA